MKFDFLLCILCFLSICFSVDANAQSNSSSKISTISFQGLEKNKENYLNKFVQSKIGDLASDSILLEDLQRLKNIPSIGDANYSLDTSQQNVKIIFKIREVRTLIPAINFGRVRDNTWFQLGLYESNLQGKGSFLSAIYHNRDKGKHSGQIYYRADRIRGTNWGFSTTLNSFASLEPLFFKEGAVNYDFNNYALGLTGIRRFGFHRKLEFGATYFVEQYRKSDIQILANPVGPNSLTQTKFLSKVEFTNDFLDYHFFYLEGYYWQFGAQNVYTISDETWFQSLRLTGKYFSRFSTDGNLAIRFQASLATNNNSPFAPFVIDSHVNLRGVGNRTARSTAQVILNAEYRVTISDEEKWAFQTLTFLDVGAWRNPGEKFEDLFNDSQFKQFFGAGIRVIYKEFNGAVFRFDYGLNIQDITQSGGVIGFGQYF